MAQLRVTSPSLKGAVFVLDRDHFTIGRAPDNDIRLPHPSVSKHHALLKVRGDDLQLFDLHSTNGVIVNGRRCAVAHLGDGDRILLGEVELCVETTARPLQRAPSPSFPQVLAQPIPPAPTPAPVPAAPKPSPASVPPPAPASTTTVVVQKKLSWLRRFRRAKANGKSNKPPEPPPTPPSRETIRAELEQTFGKMGLQMPKPPPSQRR